MTSPDACTLATFIDHLQGKIDLRPQLYFKSSLTALSHAMEDQVLAVPTQPGAENAFLVIASFQQERFYRQEARRYQRIAQQTDQVYVLAAEDTSFTHSSEDYDCIAFDERDSLHQEWNLVVLGEGYTSCLICKERFLDRVPNSSPMDPPPTEASPQSNGSVSKMDQSRQFEGVWTFDRWATAVAAQLLFEKILYYRPELRPKIEVARDRWLNSTIQPSAERLNPSPFTDRLVTYLQSGQYKLMRTYRSLAKKERQERLINLISSAIRQSLDPEEILSVAVQELGKALNACRTLVYACDQQTTDVRIRHEFLGRPVASLRDQSWPVQRNPLFQEISDRSSLIYINETQQNNQVQLSNLLQELVQNWNIQGWLLLPVFHQGQLLGILELHHCELEPDPWTPDDLELAEAVATQIGVALIQARSYAHLEDLNQQLAALEQTRDNLTAIVGHELRTPLSTVQICLESLATEPDMPPELQQTMIQTALSDAERLRQLVQDFLTLSRLESGRIDWNPEWLSLQECIDMALCSIEARKRAESVPQIHTFVHPDLPLICTDGEWVVEVLSKLLDNACKFTPATGEITIRATPTEPAKGTPNKQVELTVADTGRGIAPDRLETVFDRFYQEEGALRRTVGGTGLGLAICRQVITLMNGKIWADSPGRDQGSTFHILLPLESERCTTPMQATLQAVVEDTPRQTRKSKGKSTASSQRSSRSSKRKSRNNS